MHVAFWAQQIVLRIDISLAFLVHGDRRGENSGLFASRIQELRPRTFDLSCCLPVVLGILGSALCKPGPTGLKAATPLYVSNDT